MTAPLPVAIIGAGSIGMRHVEVALACPATEIAAVVEPDEALRHRLAQQGLPVVASLDDVPGDTRAAVVATPTPDHHASTLACLDRGWPVIVEKPIAATLDAARDLVATADRLGLPLVTGHHRRCHPFAPAARAALTEIGDLVGVQGFWSLRKHDSYYDAPWRRVPGAGPLMTNLSHEIDLLCFLVGDIDEVTALASSARRGLVIEDTAALSFRFANGALGSFLISDAGASPWAFEAATAENPAIAASDQDYVRFTGTSGALEFPSLTLWTRSGPGEIEWSKPLARRPGPAFARVDPLHEQISRFATVVAGAEDSVLCTAAEGVKALEMTLATALSAHSGRPVKAGEVPGDFSGDFSGA
ncbi:Gfo/Idh/MocA family protein [Marimonas arenosa]|uniref:Gfo/Idh/MocA family oxidoreductase n=1 Tax=Marimonas arenosa TaxID=1795305 RepID=A0AAE4B549_9RHOB|nr:Gfo/Idh/MocA family oxidoreductase [Marimonas arenosa]MDQ2088881.1 Gfo/Idh/MocA family oxidoreductase [Marimonas arenosa]